MQQTMTSALVTGRVGAGDTRASYGYIAFLLCASVPPLVATGFLVQLLAHAAPGLLHEWRLTPPEVASALAMAPAGLLAGSALGHGLRQPPLPVLLWSGAAVSGSTTAVAFARTPIEVGTLCLVASFAAGVALVQGGNLMSRVRGRGQSPLPAVVVTLLATSGAFAAWFAGAGLVESWRSACIVTGLLSAASPLAVLVASSEAKARSSDSACADATVLDGLTTAGTRATFGYLIGTAHARETSTLFALSCSTGMAAGMAALSLPLVLAHIGMPVASAAGWLSTLNLAAVAGGLAAAVSRLEPRTVLRGLTTTGLLVAGMLAIRPDMPPATALRAALIVCGFVIAAAPVTALRLASAYGPPGAHAAVKRATVAFIALGAALGVHAGVHVAIANGRSGVFAAWACAFGVSAVMAALLPLPRLRTPRSGRRSS